MAITLSANPATGIEAAQPARPAAPIAQSRPAPQKQAEPAPQPPVTHNPEETNVIFRRDVNGQIYYVFTDAQSGRELQELPPKEVRNVGQGIADLVKELQQKNSNHIAVKG
jgi:hypothetical protein